MKNIITYIFITLSFSVLSQSNDEIKMMKDINELRNDPKSFIKIVEQYIIKHEKEIDFYKKHNVKITNSSNYITNEIKISEAKKLIEELKITQPLDTLIFSKELYIFSNIRIDTLVKNNILSHDGFYKLSKFIKKTYICENISNYNKDSLLNLLLDLNSDDKDHRRNLLNSKCNNFSISIKSGMMVQIFSN